MTMRKGALEYIDWLDWLNGILPLFNSISIISQQQLVLFMSFLGYNVLGWSSSNTLKK